MNVPPIEIELDKSALSLFFMTMLLALFFGITIVNNPEYVVTFFKRLNSSDTEFIKSAGIILSLFFSGMSIFLFRKITSKKMGLIINDQGIIDNSGGYNTGLIEWKDITGIELTDIAPYTNLTLFTNDPEKYMKREKNWFLKWNMKSSLKNFGSPLLIATVSLKINKEDLIALIRSEHEKRRDNFTLKEST